MPTFVTPSPPCPATLQLVSCYGESFCINVSTVTGGGPQGFRIVRDFLRGRGRNARKFKCKLEVSGGDGGKFNAEAPPISIRASHQQGPVLIIFTDDKAVALDEVLEEEEGDEGKCRSMCMLPSESKANSEG